MFAAESCTAPSAWGRAVIVAAVLGGIGALVGACKADAPPPGVRDLTLEDPLGYPEREGMVRMVSAVHLPSSSPDQEQVEVWVSVPSGATVELGQDERGRPSLTFPPGTRSDRVEWSGHGDARRIVDVRGTRIEPDGSQSFFIYRPTAPDPRAPLFGVEWARQDTKAHEAATERMVQRLSSLPPAVSMPPPRRDRFLQGVRNKNRCAGCHRLDRPENTNPREHGTVDRGTDHSGFFTPRTVLWDEGPIERYGKHNGSLQDPALEIRCGDAVVDPQMLDERRCPGGVIAQARIRWDHAWSNGSARAHMICESRRAIAGWLSPEDRTSLASVWAACDGRQKM